MQSAAGGHHGQHGDLAVGEDLEQGRAIALDQPLQLLLDLGGLGAAVGLDTHGLGQGHEIRVLLVRVRIAVFVEQVLPLRHHALLLVVQQQHLDADVELGRRRQLGQGHVEGRVAVDVNDQSIRARHLGTDGGGKTVTHGTQATGGDHGAGMAPAEVLGRPHLMLADTGRHHGAVLDVRRQVTELLDQVLGLDGAVGVLGFVKGEGEARLPVVDLVKPLGTLGHRLDVGKQETDVLGAVALHGLVGLDHLVDVLGHDLEVDDTTTVFGGGQLGLGGELGDVTSHAIVEPRTDGDDQIGLLHGHVGIGGPVHAEHVQGLRVEFVVTTQTLQGRGDGDARLVGQFLQDLGAIGAGEQTLAHVQDGFLGDVHQAGDTVNGALELLLAQLASGQGRRAREGRDGAVHGDGLAEDAGGDILGQIDQHGAGAAGGGDLEGLMDAAGELGHGLDHDIPLGAGARDSDHVGLLEGIGTDQAGGDLAAEDDHGGAIGQGILHRGDHIGGTGAGGNQDDTGIARGAGVTLRHVAGALLVAGENEVKVFGVVDGIEHGEDSATGVTDYRFD